MKGKILVALKTKYKTFGFSDKAFDGVADYLSKTVTEEGQVETAIGGVEGLLKAFQGDVDFVRNEKSGIQKELDALKVKMGNPNPETKAEEKKDDVPAWAQSLIDSNKTLSEKLAGYEQKEIQATRQGQILAKAKEYGIPESQAKRYSIPDDADLDTYFKDVKQEFTNEGLGGVKSPEVGGDTKTDNESVASMISQGTKEIVEQKK